MPFKISQQEYRADPLKWIRDARDFDMTFAVINADGDVSITFGSCGPGDLDDEDGVPYRVFHRPAPRGCWRDE